MKKLLALIFVITALSGLSKTQAQADVRKKQFNISKDNVAVQGYDVVAYFTKGKALQGNKDISIVTDGITYYFSSTQNKDLFKVNPSKYEPQYGGWCAYAMGANNEKVEIDPETFKILDGKLFLFYHTWVNNTLTKWNKDEPNLKKKADANWTKIIH